MATRTAAFRKLRVQKLRANLNIGTSSDRSGGYGEGTPSDIDEERGTEVFIIESFQMTGASPRRCRRRPSSTAAGKIWCGAIDSPILFLFRLAGQENVMCGKIFAMQQHAFELI